MPPKADYWKHFNVVGVVAYCLIAECQQPNVSLCALPKPYFKSGVGVRHLLDMDMDMDPTVNLGDFH